MRALDVPTCAVTLPEDPIRRQLVLHRVFETCYALGPYILPNYRPVEVIINLIFKMYLLHTHLI
jgi:hypothetical protein